MNAFIALSDNTRREIVKLVARNGVLTSTEISRHFEMSPPAISQHLGILKEANILKVEKQAQKRLYAINPDGIGEIDEWLSDIKNLWSKRLNALEKYLSKIKREKRDEQK
jgi:DNA-binding transcriptional ArsR family regulator